MPRSVPLARRNLLAEPRRLIASTAGVGMATDPVCGMAVEQDATLHLQAEGHEWWFCSDSCRADFAADPDRYRAKEPVL